MVFIVTAISITFFYRSRFARTNWEGNQWHQSRAQLAWAVGLGTQGLSVQGPGPGAALAWARRALSWPPCGCSRWQGTRWDTGCSPCSCQWPWAGAWRGQTGWPASRNTQEWREGVEIALAPGSAFPALQHSETSGCDSALRLQQLLHWQGAKKPSPDTQTTEVGQITPRQKLSGHKSWLKRSLLHGI